MHHPNKLTIDPITRLEGHGKIDIFLNDKGDVENAYLIVPELRGFEKFSQGREAISMPEITSRICGVCSPAHHLASTKALDDAFKVEPTQTAKKIRQLMYNGYMAYDHILHFFYLGGPDFVVGPGADKSKRNILGVIEKVGEDFAMEVIKHRAYGQKIIEITSGKPISPVCGIPGGVNKGLDESEAAIIKKMGNSTVEFTKKSLAFFKDLILNNKEYMNLVTSPEYRLECYDMGMVDEENRLNFYDGELRVTDPEGNEFLKFPGNQYLDHIAERVVSWSYVKIPYLKKIGWKGFTTGKDSGIYRVGPLARLNVSGGMSTPIAHREFEEFYKTLGGSPVHNTLAFHWARLIELMHAAEMVVQLSEDPDILGKELRNPVNEPGEGVGVIEAARGTLFHHYSVGKDRLVEKANMIVATTNNKMPISLSIRDAAKGKIHKGKATDEALNMVEMAFRAYDPCFACASHAIDGGVAVQINVYDKNGNLLQKRNNFRN